MDWVAVSCEFQCRACGHLSPLDFLDLDGSVRCLRCGLDQAFAQGAWKTALEHAHALFDLGGGHPEGRHPHPRLSIAGENPLRGQRRSSHQQSGFVTERGMQVPTTLRLDAELGTPSCEQCRVALVTSLAGPGQVQSRCPRCYETRTYQLPEVAGKLVKGLVGVIAGEHRSDQPATRVEEDAARPGAIALRCPSCGGALEVAHGSRIATCRYCRTSSRIPEKVAFEIGAAPREPERWWLSFQGPSRARRELERAPELPSAGDAESTDRPVDDPPKANKPSVADLLLVVLLPLLLVLAVGLFDLLVLDSLELDLSGLGV